MTTTLTRNIDAQTIEPTLVLRGWISDDEPQSIVHSILGRTEPDVSLRPAAARRGSMKLLFWDAASAEAARAFHTMPALFYAASTLPWVPAAYVCADGTIKVSQSENYQRWTVEVPFVEVTA